MTKRHYKKLIKEIAKATQQNDDNSKHFAALLSAMRGPDDNNPTIKQETTEPIRYVLGWICGEMCPISKKGWQKMESYKEVVADSPHFSNHILWAFRALKYFDIIK